MPLDNMVAELTVKDGAVTLHPLSFGVGTGRIECNVALEPRGDKQLHASATVDFRRVDLAGMPDRLPLNDSRMKVSSPSTIPDKALGLSPASQARNLCLHRNA